MSEPMNFSEFPADVMNIAAAAIIDMPAHPLKIDAMLAIARAIMAYRQRDQWQDISTAPKGARGIAWMLLAYGPEGDQSVSVGLRFHDQFFAASTFYVGGRFDTKQFALREHEVTPTHWQPLPGAPKAEA